MKLINFSLANYTKRVNLAKAKKYVDVVGFGQTPQPQVALKEKMKGNVVMVSYVCFMKIIKEDNVNYFLNVKCWDLYSTINT